MDAVKQLGKFGGPWINAVVRWSTSVPVDVVGEFLKYTSNLNLQNLNGHAAGFGVADGVGHLAEEISKATDGTCSSYPLALGGSGDGAGTFQRIEHQRDERILEQG